MPKYSDVNYDGWPVQAHHDLLAEYRDFYKIGRISSPLWLCAQLWGYEDYLAAILEAPELLVYACERYLSILAAEVRQLKSLGVQAVWIEECFTDMISAESFRNLNVPAVTQLIDEVRSQGLKSIYYFTGDPRRKLSMIVETHPDALSFEEGKKGFPNDICQLAEVIGGRCTLIGNLDAVDVLQNGSDETLRAALVEQIQAGRNNKDRFIVGLGSPVTPDTPVERTRNYCQLAHELGAEI